MPAKPPSKKSAKTERRPTASEVTPGVFVGGWGDALQFSGTKFCVLDEAPDDMPPATHIPIYNPENKQPILANLDRLAGRITEARSRGETVLVFCGHGVRRAPLGGAWYLHRSKDVSLDAAFEQVESVRPGIEHVKTWAKGWKVLDEADSPKGRPGRNA